MSDTYSDRTPTLDALEEMFWNGFADEMSGNVDSPVGYFYRVGRCIVATDSQGFHYLETFETEALAGQVFMRLEAAYCEWENGDDDNV